MLLCIFLGFLIVNSRDLLYASRIKLKNASCDYELFLYVHIYCNYNISALVNPFSDLL